MKIKNLSGKSLANGEGINKVLDIIEDKIKQQENRHRFRQDKMQQMSYDLTIAAKKITSRY
jgi:hypothetical protein